MLLTGVYLITSDIVYFILYTRYKCHYHIIVILYCYEWFLPGPSEYCD